MQYLTIKRDDTLQNIAKIVGRLNADLVLSENSLERSPRIGQQYYNRCAEYLATNPEDVTPSRKSALLNNLTDNEEVFEKACLMDEEGWKIFSAFQSFPDAIKIPESIQLPYSTRVIGTNLGDNLDNTIGSGVTGSSSSSGGVPYSTSDAVSSTAYKKVMDSLKETGTIPPEIFNTVNVSRPISLTSDKNGFKSGRTTFGRASATSRQQARVPQYAYNLPWGKIQLYSSVLDQTIDIPVYPEELDTERQANYTDMPDIIYQYEPWVVYQSSGPREQTVDFHLHRDLWSGNHLDGEANRLIRFCEANTFPRYSGSAVLAPLVRLYISGSTFISGVLTRTRTHWSGPLGLDNWYLEFTLSLTIREVSDVALNIDSVSNFGLIGG